MSVSLTAYFPSSNLERCLEILLKLPPALRPCQYTSGERRPKKGAQMVSDEHEFKGFVQKNPAGFMLVGRVHRYNLFLRQSSGFSIVRVDAGRCFLAEEDALTLLGRFCLMNVPFAFVADEEEFHHRNRVVRAFGESQVEAWVGRELNNYIPGLYWLTLVSGEECAKKGWNVADMPNDWRRLDISSSHVALRLYDHSSDWKIHANKVDGYCNTHEAFFSKERALSELNKTHDYQEFSQSLRNWL